MLEKRLKAILKEVTQRAAIAKKLVFFSIANTANVNNAPILFPAIRETEEVICGNVLITSLDQAKQIAALIDGFVDSVLIDVETKLPGLEGVETWMRKHLKKSKLLAFKPNDFTVESLDALLAEIASPLRGKKIAIIGAGNIGSKAALKLVEHGADVIITRRNEKVLKKIVEGLNAIKQKYEKAKVMGIPNSLKASLDADIIVGATPGVAVITKEMVQAMKPSGFIIDVGNGTLFDEAIRFANQSDIKILCLSMKPGFDGALKTILETQKVVQRIKRRSAGDFAMISGGILGKTGDIIVDDAEKPTRVLAIADGKGDVMADIKDSQFKKNIRKVEQIIKESGIL